jgi:ATP-dependent helicase/nuclease subunit A
LILSGTVTERRWQTLWTKPDTVTPREILAAKCCADWLGLWFAQNAPGVSAEMTEGKLPHVRWRIVGDEELAEKWGEPCEPNLECGNMSPFSKAPTRRRTPKFPSLAEALDKETKQKLRAALTWEYGFSTATKQAAKSSVTALRRRAADESDDEAEQTFTSRQFAQAAKRVRGKLSATETGSAHHKFLQYLALENTNDVAALKSEAGRLEREKVLSADECAALDLEAVAAFWNSEPGRRIRDNAASVRRELAFTAKFSPQALSEIIGTEPEAGLENEFVVVQGVADLVVLLPEELWLLDFKTDEVRAGGLPAKVKIYAPQLILYARALAKIYTRPVNACWLHFLSARSTVDLDV